jgi:hypothetical protein
MESKVIWVDIPTHSGASHPSTISQRTFHMSSKVVSIPTSAYWNSNQARLLFEVMIDEEMDDNLNIPVIYVINDITDEGPPPW